jgi:hypothetical protein
METNRDARIFHIMIQVRARKDIITIRRPILNTLQSVRTDKRQRHM